MQRLLTTPPQRLLTAIAVATSVATVLISRAFVAPETAMRARGAGIVDYELAFTAEKAGAMLTAWGSEGQEAARVSLLIDFGFIPSYAVALAGITLLITRAQPGLLQVAGLRIAPVPILAAVFDILENLMLLSMLGQTAVSPIPPLVAGIAASIKFVLLLVAVLYWLLAGGGWLVRRLRPG